VEKKQVVKRITMHTLVCALGTGFGIWILLAMVSSSAPSIFDQYRLSDSKSVAEGLIIDTGEEYERSDAGQDLYSWWGKVRYVTDSGKVIETYIGNTTSVSAMPPQGRVRVRYLATDPSVVWIDAIHDGQEWKETKWPRSRAQFWQEERLRVFGLVAIALWILAAGVWYGVKGARRILTGLPEEA
jgi:hypothetical protein